jgi:hypothetical protein
MPLYLTKKHKTISSILWKSHIWWDSISFGVIVKQIIPLASPRNDAQNSCF